MRAGDVTLILQRAATGDRSCTEQLYAAIYDSLHDIAAGHMRRERPDHTLQTTGLVHECFMKMMKQRADFKNRSHFLAIASRAMRRILLDYEKRRRAIVHGGGVEHVSANDSRIELPSASRDVDLVELDELLDRLAAFNPVGVKIAEMKIFGGMTTEEIASALSEGEGAVSTRTVERKWEHARLWLASQLREAEGRDGGTGGT